jgi:hypothetical protein
LAGDMTEIVFSLQLILLQQEVVFDIYWIHSVEKRREEQRVRVLENRVWRKIYRSKIDWIRGGWRNLQNEELHKLHSSPNTIIMMKLRKMRVEGNVARMRKEWK